jgi:RNA polymerase sigma-70 factor (ECF subfamily)
MSSDRVTALYRKYGPTIYWRCLRLLGDAGAAEDATQETFVRVHRHLARAPSDAEAIAWIWRIATNLCLNERRDAGRRPMPIDVPPDLGDPSLRGLHEDRDLARRVIARADARDRVVAWLYHVGWAGAGRDRAGARDLPPDRREPPAVIRRTAVLRRRRSMTRPAPSGSGS